MKQKICLVSSTGGHFMELMQLLPAVEGKDYYIVTEKNPSTEGVLKKHRHYLLKQQQRNGWKFAFVFAYNILMSLIYLLKERPTTVICTGAGASYPTCRFAKWLGCKVIYVESFAKLSNSSVTGQMVYKFADKFFIQWEEMKKIYPNAIYSGTVY